MPAVMVTADLEHPDHDKLASGLKNLLRADEISGSPELDLAVKFDLDPVEGLTMVVHGRDADTVAFVSRCRGEGVTIRAVREDDESRFRLV